MHTKACHDCSVENQDVHQSPSSLGLSDATEGTMTRPLGEQDDGCPCFCVAELHCHVVFDDCLVVTAAYANIFVVSGHTI